MGRIIIAIIVVLIVFGCIFYKSYHRDNESQNAKSAEGNQIEEQHPIETGYRTSAVNDISNLINEQIVASIRKCESKEDVQYKLIEAETAVERKIQQTRAVVQEARQQGYIKLSTEWMKRFDELIEVSNTLNQNLILENNRKLQMNKFYRYNDLWFRSMLMGDIAYNDYTSALASLDEIGTVLVSIDKGKIHVGRTEKTKLYEIKDAFKEARDVLLKRVQAINAQTATLRDKIGAECGERGKQWWSERMRGRT